MSEYMLWDSTHDERVHITMTYLYEWVYVIRGYVYILRYRTCPSEYMSLGNTYVHYEGVHITLPYLSKSLKYIYDSKFMSWASLGNKHVITITWLHVVRVSTWHEWVHITIPYLSKLLENTYDSNFMSQYMSLGNKYDSEYMLLR